MRVLQFGKFFPPYVGGIERVIYNLTEGLNSKGVRCDVLCSNDRNEYVEETINSYSVVRTRSYGIYQSTSVSPQLVQKLCKVQQHYDIIHTHLPDPTANIALFFARPKARLVLHWHNDIVRQKILLKFYQPFQKWMLKRADRIIATSPNYIEGSPYLAEFRTKCRVIPVGVDTGHLKTSEETVGTIRNRFKGKRVVFSIGRLRRYKGYEYLVEAANFLSDAYVILIGGTGTLRQKLSQQIVDQGLQGKVFLLGEIKNEDIGSYYQACDLFCLSSISRSEGFGIVQVEAMLFKKPVVSTNIKGSGVPWVNVHGRTGLVVQTEDPVALAEAIDRICSDRELYGRLAANAFKRATQDFRRETMVSSTIKLYRHVLSGE